MSERKAMVLRAERLKHRRTAVGRLMVLMPLISVVTSARLTHVFFAVDGYNWWYMMLFPGLVALVCGSISERDEKLGNRAIWSLPCDLRAVWDAKVAHGVFVSGISAALLAALVVVVSFYLEHVKNITFLIRPTLAALLIWLSFCWQVPYCLFLCQALGRIPMLLIHMLGYGVMAFAGSLSPFYMLMPGALAARMMCAVLGVLPNGLPAVPGEMTFQPELLQPQSIPVGIAASVIWFTLFWALGHSWYGRRAQRA